ncbi:transposase DNA-binding-containing protein [Escherichia coli]|uniref:transposase DNA-binding-containing protein n=1 Tax=Escherichia coli TaxID=562 RepID=UPI003C2D81AC
MIWQPEFTDKTLSRKPGAVQRRTRRLVSLTSSLAQHAGLSIVKSSHFTAQVEGAYRLIRNPSVSP